AGAVAAYVAKYATKSIDGGGRLDHRLGARDVRALAVRPHLGRLVETAWRLGGQSDMADLRLREWAHTLGFRGHWLTKSRRYSTTFAALRTARQAWRVARTEVRRGEEAKEFVVDIGSWSYAGRRHNNDGERWLAVSLAIRRSQWRA